MGKLVLLHKASSIYDDEPDTRYDFPRQYLRAMEEAIGDWIVYYEPVRAGGRGYFATAMVQDIVPNSATEGRFIAVISPDSYIEFDAFVPFDRGGVRMESSLMNADGTRMRGGAVQLAVRRLPEAEFAAIVNEGLPGDLEQIEARRYEPAGSAFDETVHFERPVLERLTRRKYRDVAFRRRVREAYGYRCAISGLSLRNGGGRPEVEAAHIRPVAEGGSDSVRNGLALSGTLHWMFDRGLITVAEDRRILVSHNKVPGDVVARLISPDQTLHLPADPRDAPSPAALRWHRENVYGRGAPWDGA